MPQQQLVEIARAVGSHAHLIIMDEPTASLSTREVDKLLTIVRELAKQGTGILYVSHRLEELAEIAQRVTVLRDGAWVTTCAMAQTSPAELVRHMVGREVAQVFPKAEVPIGEPRLAVSDLSCRSVGIQNVNFEVRAGEILGIGGLMGAGRLS